MRDTGCTPFSRPPGLEPKCNPHVDELALSAGPDLILVIVDFNLSCCLARFQVHDLTCWVWILLPAPCTPVPAIHMYGSGIWDLGFGVILSKPPF